jgi:hypothetical protein
MSTHCSNCRRELGAETKVQPTTVDGTSWCPLCFVARRMADDPSRFNASQAVAAKCVFCGWTVVSFGARPGQGRMHCSHCSREGALKVRFVDLPLTERETKQLAEIVHESRKQAHIK